MIFKMKIMYISYASYLSNTIYVSLFGFVLFHFFTYFFVLMFPIQIKKKSKL